MFVFITNTNAHVIHANDPSHGPGSIPLTAVRRRDTTFLLKLHFIRAQPDVGTHCPLLGGDILYVPATLERSTSLSSDYLGCPAARWSLLGSY